MTTATTNSLIVGPPRLKSRALPQTVTPRSSGVSPKTHNRQPCLHPPEKLEVAVFHKYKVGVAGAVSTDRITSTCQHSLLSGRYVTITS